MYFSFFFYASNQWRPASRGNVLRLLFAPTDLPAALLLDALHRKDVLSRGGQLHFPTGARQRSSSAPSPLLYVSDTVSANPSQWFYFFPLPPAAPRCTSRDANQKRGRYFLPPALSVLLTVTPSAGRVQAAARKHSMQIDVGVTRR